MKYEDLGLSFVYSHYKNIKWLWYDLFCKSHFLSVIADSLLIHKSSRCMCSKALKCHWRKPTLCTSPGALECPLCWPSTDGWSSEWVNFNSSFYQRSGSPILENALLRFLFSRHFLGFYFLFSIILNKDTCAYEHATYDANLPHRRGRDFCFKSNAVILILNATIRKSVSQHSMHCNEYWRMNINSDGIPRFLFSLMLRHQSPLSFLLLFRLLLP